MPVFTVNCHTPLTRSFRTEQVAGLFDLPLDQIESRLAHSLTVELPGLDEDWTIGAIVGPSGSGKTTLARAVYGDALYEPPTWPHDAAIIDCLGNAPIKQLAHTLTAVGLGSVPTWLKPYRVLSTGERFRADLARAILANAELGMRNAESTAANQSTADTPQSEFRTPHLLVIDEFTSTLDRTIAQTASAALARLLRSQSATPHSEFRTPHLLPLRLVVLTCHTDILPWLAPDWVLDLGARGAGVSPAQKDARAGETPAPRVAAFTRGCLQRPQLHLTVRRVPQCLWPHFARHHYLAGGLAASATCYAAFWPEGDQVRNAECGMRNEEPAPLRIPNSELRISPRPVAFCAVVASLGWKKTKRITRLVTLPEFQGLGIASRLAETVAAHEQAKGFRVTITASHPAILAHCSRSPNWQYLSTKKTGSTRQKIGDRPIRCSAGRAVASFEFVGERSASAGAS